MVTWQIRVKMYIESISRCFFREKLKLTCLLSAPKVFLFLATYELMQLNFSGNLEGNFKEIVVEKLVWHASSTHHHMTVGEILVSRKGWQNGATYMRSLCLAPHCMSNSCWVTHLPLILLLFLQDQTRFFYRVSGKNGWFRLRKF